MLYCIVNKNQINNSNTNNFRIKRRFKATIIGFIGTYKEAPISVDATKGYSREEIENYKLLTDPNFPQYYYNKEGGNSYFVYGKPQVNSTTKKMELFPDLTQKNYQHKLFDYDKIAGRLCIRFRHDGDRMVVNSSGDERKLKKEFIDRKVPESMRNKVLLVSDEAGVLWAMGVRRSERAYVDGETRNVLEIRIEEQ